MKAFSIKRRAVLAALAASPAALAAGPQYAGPPASLPPARRRTLAYTAVTAPDAIGRTVLARKLDRLDDGRLAGQSRGDAIRANLQQLIEQNFARMDPMRATRFVKGLSATEKRALAQTYLNATANAGRPAALYDLMALRMNGQQFGAVSEYFGFAPCHAAVLRTSPDKAFAFEQSGSTAWTGPTYGAMVAPQQPALLASTGLAYGAKQVAAAPVTNSIGPLLDLPLYEIWGILRTAPHGALSVKATGFLFTTFVAGSMLTAWESGYFLGTHIVRPIIETFAPSLWDAIGSGVNSFMEGLRTAPPEDVGPIEALGAGAGLFNLESNLMDSIEYTGGDFQIAEAWQSWAGSGGGWSGGGGGCEGCEWVISL